MQLTDRKLLNIIMCSLGRNARITHMLEAGKKVGRTFKFMWVVGGENGEIEEKLGLGFGSDPNHTKPVQQACPKQRIAATRRVFSESKLLAKISLWTSFSETIDIPCSGTLHLWP